MKDIFLLVKKLGALCSRPEKTAGDFNFTVYLSKLEADTLSKISALMSEQGARADVSAPAAAPAAAEQQTPPVVEKPKTESTREMPFVPSVTMRIKAASIKAETKPENKPGKGQESGDVPSTASILNKTKWSVELPLVPTHSFQTLVSGSHNRFAHAAAMAIVENPGVMYNPLLIFGIPGTGKTHFVHAISYGLSSSIGQNNIFVTDGIKLSKGTDLAIQNGTIDKLSEIMARVKVLIVDDIHLLMLTGTNKKYITKWFNDFMAKDKQIVVTSVFPPKSLGALEETAGFQFTQGWMVDLKPPTPQAYRVILEGLLQGMDVRLSEGEIGNLFSLRSVPFGEVVSSLVGMKKLEKFAANAASPVLHSQLLDMLLGLSEARKGSSITEAEYAPAAAWKPSSANSWFKWGIFYPKGMKQEAPYVLYEIHRRSGEMGLQMEWQQLFMEEYNPDELYGIPFKVGNFASEHNANGVIIMGPQPTSALGAQEAEFRHITLKILDSFLIKGAWIQFGQIKSTAAYTKILMDLL